MGDVRPAREVLIGGAVRSCVSTVFCKKVLVGPITSARAYRSCLWWLQVTSVGLSLLALSGVPSEVSTFCRYIGGIGICECEVTGATQSCWSSQVIYRLGAASFSLFMGAALISPLSQELALGTPLLKYLIVFFLSLILSVFLPNAFFLIFALVSCVASASFTVAQCVWLVDMLFGINSMCYQQFVNQVRQNFRAPRNSFWTSSCIFSSGLMLLVAMVIAIHLCSEYGRGPALAVIIGTFLSTFAMLCLSVSDWCKHGALLPSSGIAMFGQLIAWRALANSTASQAHSPPPVWLSLSMVFVAMLYALMHPGGMHDEPAVRPPGNVELTERRLHDLAALVVMSYDPQVPCSDDGNSLNDNNSLGSRQQPEGDDSALGFKVQVHDVLLHNSMHGLCAMHVIFVLSPLHGVASSTAHYVALLVSLISYFWILVMPPMSNSHRAAGAHA